MLKFPLFQNPMAILCQSVNTRHQTYNVINLLIKLLEYVGGYIAVFEWAGMFGVFLKFYENSSGSLNYSNK